MNHLQIFQQYRRLLVAIAYRMLGSATEAEDILQDAYLRRQDQSLETVHNPKYYLTTITTRLCLNELNAARTKRESYLGPWLPEPVLTENPSAFVNPAERAATYDSISIAFLILLESLSPAERAVFLLRELFGYKYAEVAGTLDKSEAACRQLFRRARGHIDENRPRFDVAPADHDKLLSRFILTVETGEIEEFLQMLADDVTLVPDGGGQRGAAIRIVKGRESVSAFILGVRQRQPAGTLYELVTLNGQRAILALTPERQPFFALFLYARDGLVHRLYVIAGRNLAGLDLGATGDI